LLGTGTGGNYFYGNMSNVRFYNRALSSNEQVNVYSWNAPTNGLVAYYPLNDIGTQVIQGTFSSTGAAASNVTWTGGSFKKIKREIPRSESDERL